MIPYNIDELDATAEEKAELKILVAGTNKFLQDIKQNPELATQFLQEIGLLDENGDRKILPGEEHLNLNGNGAKNGDATWLASL